MPNPQVIFINPEYFPLLGNNGVLLGLFTIWTERYHVVAAVRKYYTKDGRGHISLCQGQIKMVRWSQSGRQDCQNHWPTGGCNNVNIQEGSLLHWGSGLLTGAEMPEQESRLIYPHFVYPSVTPHLTLTYNQPSPVTLLFLQTVLLKALFHKCRIVLVDSGYAFLDSLAQVLL